MAGRPATFVASSTVATRRSAASWRARDQVIDPERAQVPARLAGLIAAAGERAVYPYTAEGPGTGTLAPFTVSVRRPERQGA
jgi:hypothetical protein